MFGGVAEQEVRSGYTVETEAEHRVYIPVAPEYPDTPREGPEHRDRMPRVDQLFDEPNFFAKYPRKWTWESWAKRVEYEWITMARSLDSVIYGTIGAMLGLALAGIPGAFANGYSFVIWQPLGAAIGAACGLLFARRRWQGIFQSHDDLL